MRVPDRGEASRLPVSAARWEVALVDVPITIQGVETEGLLVIVEESSGLARGVGPIVVGSGLWPVLGPAMVTPLAPCVAARPPRLLCDDPGVAERLRRELSGFDVSVHVVARLPAVGEVLGSLRGAFSPPPADEPLVSSWTPSVLERPRDEWPKISATLIRFTHETLGDDFLWMPAASRKTALSLACTVWNAVVLADHGNTPAALREVLDRARGNPAGLLVEQLVLRKRRYFAADPRLIDGVVVKHEDGELRVTAEARLPAGYRPA